ncbi:MAG: cation:proton antiporter [Gammaproteobacteria bacterium]|nr:cation:proton antiporter [Gammaproteobacteria bacterium]
MSMHESIEFQMSLLLAVALAGHLLSSLVRQPAVVGQIIAGLLVGPSLLGWITYTHFVANIAHLGAIVLLFVVGLEFRARELAAIRPFIIAVAGVLVPWIAGYLLARGFDFDSSRAMLIGVALSATSIAITADTLRELGVLQTPAARLIIGAAVIDDVLALLALSLAEQVSSGTIVPITIVLMLAKAVAFIGLGTVIGTLVLSRIAHYVDNSRFAERSPEFVFVLGMLTAFTYAMIAEYLGLSAIVGAFVAGIVFEDIKVTRSRSVHIGAEYVRAAFGAVFFVSLGVLADLRVLDADTLWFAAALTLVALLSKFVGCGLTARLCGSGVRDSLVIGVGMAPRGEVAMVIALLALNRGIIEQPAYVALVLMSLVTTLVVPVLLRNWLFRN